MERANNNILLVPMGLLLEGLSFFKKKEKKIASKVKYVQTKADDFLL